MTKQNQIGIPGIVRVSTSQKSLAELAEVKWFLPSFVYCMISVSETCRGTCLLPSCMLLMLSHGDPKEKELHCFCQICNQLAVNCHGYLLCMHLFTLMAFSTWPVGREMHLFMAISIFRTILWSSFLCHVCGWYGCCPGCVLDATGCWCFRRGRSRSTSWSKNCPTWLSTVCPRDLKTFRFPSRTVSP